jgi:heme exporter protein D
VTISLLLCMMAVALALLEAFRGFFNLPGQVNFGWLAFALWALSLLVR